MRTAPTSGERPRADGVPEPLRADELSRFERLLLDLSTGFINLPAARIDEAIARADLNRATGGAL